MCTIIHKEKAKSKLILGITKAPKITPLKTLCGLGKYISYTYVSGAGQVSLGLC